MTEFKKILQQSLSLATEGKTEDALTDLDKGLEFAIKETNHLWIVLFSRNAGILCYEMGDLKRAKKYCLISLRHDKSDPRTYYFLGKIYKQLGKKTLASRYFNTGYEMAVKNNDKDMLEIFENLKKSNEIT